MDASTITNIYGSCLDKDFGVSLNYAKTLAIKQVSGEKNSGVLLRGHSGG